jgi:hypothetical protein
MAANLYYLAMNDLKPGERLIWHGCCLSQMGKQEKPSGPVAGLFGGGVLGFFAGIVLFSISGLSFLLLILLTVPVGALLGYRFLPSSSTAYRKSRTIYALTDRRVFVLRDLDRHRQVKSLPLQFIEGIALNGGDPISKTGLNGMLASGDRGTITFSVELPRNRKPNDSYLRFFMTGDAQRVAGLVAEAREKVIAGTA